MESLERGTYRAIVHGQRVVFLVDLSDLHVLPDDTIERVTKMLRADNPRVLKSAFLLPASAVSALQMERSIREAQNPQRRAFRAVPDLLGFVEPSLDADELVVARSFFQREPRSVR